MRIHNDDFSQRIEVFVNNDGLPGRGNADVIAALEGVEIMSRDGLGAMLRHAMADLLQSVVSMVRESGEVAERPDGAEEAVAAVRKALELATAHRRLVCGEPTPGLGGAEPTESSD